jgi:hypothetical protein
MLLWGFAGTSISALVTCTRSHLHASHSMSDCDCECDIVYAHVSSMRTCLEACLLFYGGHTGWLMCDWPPTMTASLQSKTLNPKL